MPRIRADNAACAICMDSLFTTLDDLDQLVPACAPDCGHVFHEPCLHDWFRAQSVQYLAQAREHQLDRDPSPSASEAPALCPTCRTEVFADQDTGEPVLHRLYINYGDDAGGSSQVGSSPVRGTQSRRRDKEIMGIARRAKGISDDVKNLNIESSQKAVDDLLAKAEGLKDDAVSVKAIQGVKTYVGGLTIAINNLRSNLAQSPLPATLQATIDTLRGELSTMTRAMAILNTVRLPEAVNKAKLEERKVCQKETEKVKAELALVTRGLKEETVQRRAQRKAAEEREQQFIKDMGDLKRRLKLEEEERTALQDTLRERTKQLRTYQVKNENRKDLKEQNQQLEQENKTLREKLAKAATQSRKSTRSASPESEAEAGPSVPRHATSTAGSSVTRRMDHDLEEDSLEIELPSFADDPSRRHLSPKKSARAGPSSNAPRLHPTARTFSFDELDTIPAVTRKRKPNQSNHSKYFQPGDEIDLDSEEEDDSLILIQASSPPKISPTKRSRTNPFSTTREAHTAKTTLQPKKKETEVIDLASSSPGTPLRPAKINIPRPEVERPKQKSALASIFTDVHGRPKKGLAVGAKVRHRA